MKSCLVEKKCFMKLKTKEGEREREREREKWLLKL